MTYTNSAEKFVIFTEDPSVVADEFISEFESVLDAKDWVQDVQIPELEEALEHLQYQLVDETDPEAYAMTIAEIEAMKYDIGFCNLALTKTNDQVEWAS